VPCKPNIEIDTRRNYFCTLEIKKEFKKHLILKN